MQSGFPASGAYRHGMFVPLPTPKEAKVPHLDVGKLDADIQRVAGEQKKPRAQGGDISVFGQGSKLKP